MSYGLMVYRVKAARITSLYGSKDVDLLKRITGWSLENFATNEEKVERLRAEAESYFDYQPHPIWAVRDLIMGRKMTFSGAEYGYGYEYLMGQLGSLLNNSLFYPMSFEYAEAELDPELEAAGTSLRMSSLLFGGALISFPPPDDFPAFGYWSAEKVASSVAPLQAYSSTRPEIAAIRKWCEAAASKGQTIVGFYH